MHKLSRYLLGLFLAVACAGVALAQDQSFPKVLQITREYTKPGKGGPAHERAESAFVQALTRAKWRTYYTALSSLSGKSRTLFFTRYASFEAWEQDYAATDKNPALSAALDRAAAVDGELLDSMDQGVFLFREDLSLRPATDISHFRFLEIASYRVRAGHTAEWNELVKMVKDAYEKSVPEAHWGVFQGAFGVDGGTYLVLVGRKSLSEVDKGFNEDDPKFVAALGDDGMKRLEELEGSAVEASQHQLFAFNPQMSYVPEEWKQADSFWKPKAAPAPASKPAAAEKKAAP